MNEALMTAYFRECRRWPDGRQRLAAKGLRALRCNRIARLLGGGLNDGWAGGDGAGLLVLVWLRDQHRSPAEALEEPG